MGGTTCTGCGRFVYVSDVDAQGRCVCCQPADPRAADLLLVEAVLSEAPAEGDDDDDA